MVATGSVDDVVVEVDGGKTMTKPRRPLFGELIEFLRYFSVWETETWVSALKKLF